MNSKQKKRASRLKWRELHPEQWREEKRRWYARRRKAAGKPYNPQKRRSMSTVPEKAQAQFGITQEEYDALWEGQHGRCAICDKALKAQGTNGYGSAHIDHCHRTNIVRGLLCGQCNLGIGQLREDIWILKRAIAYLNKFKRLH